VTVFRVVHVLAADLMRVLWRQIPVWAENARNHK